MLNNPFNENINRILRDKKTWELFRNGETVGIVHFGTKEMLRRLRKLCPENIMDLSFLYTIANQPYKPDEADELMQIYIRNKKQAESIVYIHPFLEYYLKHTHGILLYQEQLHAMLQSLLYISQEDAICMRKDVMKKDALRIEHWKKLFFEKSLKNQDFVIKSNSMNKAPKMILEELWDYFFSNNAAVSAKYSTTKVLTISCFMIVYIRNLEPHQHHRIECLMPELAL